MTRREKRRFDRVPEEWDGIELRQLVADTFAAQARSLSMRAGLTAADRKRRRDYANEVLVRNLLA